MKFNLKDYFKIGMITTALILNTNLQKAYGLEKVVNQTQKQTQQQKIKQKREVSTSELIKLATLEDCLDFVKRCKNNKPFKQQIKKYGLQKTSKHVAGLKFHWIDLAQEYSNTNKEIPKERYELIAKQIGIKQENFYKGHTNKKAKKVIKAQAKTGKIVTNYYRRLIENNPLKNKNQRISRRYLQLIRFTFTEKEYNEYCNALCNSMSNYYNALGKTLGWKIFIGGKDIKKMKQASRKHYFAVRDRVYSK